jgi:hypothetical protein
MFIHIRSYGRGMLLQAACLAAATLAATASAAAQAPEVSHAQVVANFGKLPLRFELNRGQADPRVKFLTRGTGYGLYLTGHEAVLALHKSDTNRRPDVLRIQVAGSHPSTQPSGEDRLPGVVNYLQSSNTSTWKTDIPTFSRVRYASVYPGIDLIYYGNQQQLEYDFVLGPHKQASTIRLRFSGAQRLTLDSAGNLLINATEGSIAFHKPVIYQTIGSERKAIAGHFTLLASDTVGFHIGTYDRTQPLVIDPTLIYSTYLGGTIQDGVTAMAVDSAGEAFVTGSTTSGSNTAPNFPTTPGAYLTTAPAGYYTPSAFVSKFNASGTALLYSTYLPPGAVTSGIALDSSGNAILIGSTTSKTYPVTAGVFQSTNKAASGSANAFITKLNATGSALIFSTYLGGSTSDSPTGLAVNSAGDIYLSGITYSTDFPVTAGVYQAASKGSSVSYYWNNFITEINPTGTSLIFSTYLGGSHEYNSPPSALIAVDPTGNVYLSSTATSTDFPTTSGAFKTTNPDSAYQSITLSKLNPTATQLLYSTYLDGTGASYDQVRGLAVDSAGNLYAGGTTGQTNFPITSGALQTNNKSSGTTGFVTKLNPTGTALVYSTYLGGSTTGDGIYGLALDGSGDAFVCGKTLSTDYPTTTGAYQTTNPENAFNGSGSTPILSELNPAGTALLYSTYFGGANPGSSISSIALGASSSVFLAGTTTLTLPVTPNAYESTATSQYGSTGFVAEFSFGSAPTTLPTTTSLLSISNPSITGSNLTFSAYVAPNTGSAIPSGNVVFSVDNVAVATVALNSKGIAAYTTTTPLTLGQHYILASYAGNATYTASAGSLTESITPATPILSPASGPYTSAQLVSITGATPSAKLYYTIDGSTPTASSLTYTAPFLVSTSTVVNAIAILSGSPSSNVQTAFYSFLGAPSVLAVNASSIGTATATLNALVGTGGVAGSYHFIYGISSSTLNSTTASTSFGGSVLSRLSIAPFQATANLTTLQTKTTYYFQIVVTTPAGTSSGQVLSFKTN